MLRVFCYLELGY